MANKSDVSKLQSPITPKELLTKDSQKKLPPQVEEIAVPYDHQAMLRGDRDTSEAGETAAEQKQEEETAGME